MWGPSVADTEELAANELRGERLSVPPEPTIGLSV